MLHLDAFLIGFLEHNTLSLMLVFGILKTLANRSKNTLDDDILNYLTSFLPKKKK